MNEQFSFTPAIVTSSDSQRSAAGFLGSLGRLSRAGGLIVRAMLCVGIVCSGSVATASPDAVPRFSNLGSLHHPITTTSEQAQQYFDQGLRWLYAFNHEEAILAFEEATRRDPTAAMAYWGIALALGPNINAPMGKADERRAWGALQHARVQAGHVSPAEQRYIDALGKRYSAKAGSHPALDKAYTTAIQTV